MTEKLKGFHRVEQIAEGQFKYSLSDGRKVFVLWSDAGDKTVSLINEISSGSQVIVTRVVTQNGKTTPTTENEPASAVQVTQDPAFVEEAKP